MRISFTRKRAKHENTRSPPFSYDTKMAANGYWARKALILRELLKNNSYSLTFGLFFTFYWKNLTLTWTQALGFKANSSMLILLSHFHLILRLCSHWLITINFTSEDIARLSLDTAIRIQPNTAWSFNQYQQVNTQNIYKRNQLYWGIFFSWLDTFLPHPPPEKNKI